MADGEGSTTLELPRISTVGELGRRLSTLPLAVVKEASSAARFALDAEIRRGPTLDSRATSLLGAAALAVTIAFTIAGQLLPTLVILIKPRAIYPLFSGSVLAGITTTVLAVIATRTGPGYAILSSEAVFFHTTDETQYNRVLALHFWQIAAAHTRANDRKARWIRRAQWCFVVFLLLVTILAGITVISKLRNLA